MWFIRNTRSECVNSNDLFCCVLALHIIWLSGSRGCRSTFFSCLMSVALFALLHWYVEGCWRCVHHTLVPSSPCAHQMTWTVPTSIASSPGTQHALAPHTEWPRWEDYVTKHSVIILCHLVWLLSVRTSAVFYIRDRLREIQKRNWIIWFMLKFLSWSRKKFIYFAPITYEHQ